IASNEHFLVQKLNELGMLYCRSDFFEDAILDLAERMVGLRAVPEIPATAIIYTNASTEAREKAIVQDQDEAASCFNEGIAKYHQQQYTEAIASMAKARDLNPKWATTWHFLACFYQHEGELDQAMACCIKALELDPRLAVSLNVEASVHLKRGEFDGTIDCCKKALELDPGLGLSWKLLGHAYSKKNLNDEAIQCFNRALALDPNDVEAWYTLGTLFVKNQDAGEATRCFTKAISLKSDHAPSLRALAEVKREPVKVVQVKAAATTEVSTMEPKAMLPGLAPPFAPYDGVEPYLFVSHAVADRADVYPIIEHLHKEGIRIWFDQGVPSGEAWWDMIDDRIKHCATFMVFLSQNAISEPYILGEIVLAKRRLEKEEIRFIPVFLNPLELPTQIGLIIRNIPPVVNQGSNNRQFMERVLRSIVDAVRLGRRGAKHS
nr:tetratricopeptide repeat protein [Candidatus Sigynarchaeota archaeon]